MTSDLDALFDELSKTLNVSEVAALLGMTKPGVYKWIKEGTIPAYRVGSTWFILRDELKHTLEAGANTHRGPGRGAEETADEQ
ncbi:MAG: helix-turn-helix domain-containing protein [Rhodoglobus sp.]